MSIISFPGLRLLNFFLKKANADDLKAAQATLKGLKTRYKETGIPPIFIETVCNATGRPYYMLMRIYPSISLVLVSVLASICNEAHLVIVWIHIGVLADNAAGDYAIDTIYDDANTVQIETLADTQPHRNVDLELINADKEGAWQFSYIPIPSLYIYI